LFSAAPYTRVVEVAPEARGGGVRVLIVDDDSTARRLLRFVLEASGGHAVVEASDGREALERLEGCDLVIADLVMPNLDGFGLCKAVRVSSWVPILAVSASRTGVSDRVAALRLGADDFLGKPFDPTELLARVDALARAVRRRAQLEEDGGLRVGDLRLDLLQQSVQLGDDAPIALTPTECRLLARLAQTPGHAVSRHALQQALWGHASRESETTLSGYVADLRRKIESDPHRPRRVITVRGAGYRLA
jgi:DNA-binding response OmpR family regulator